MTTRLIYWGPTGAAFPNGFTATLDAFVGDIAASTGSSTNVTAVAPQYVDASGGALTGGLTNDPSVVDRGAYPASGCAIDSLHPTCLTDPQITAELSSFVAAMGYPTGIGYSYVVVMPPGVRVCFDASSGACSGTVFCGYHGDFYPSGSTTPYTVLPYPEVNGCTTGNGPGAPSQDAADTIEAHELMETATDPIPGSGYVDVSGYEIGDDCAWFFGPTSPGSSGGQFNQILNGNQYLLQEMWSNADNSCAQGLLSNVSSGMSSSPVVETGEVANYTAALENDSSPLASVQWDYSTTGGTPQQIAGTEATASTSFPIPGTYTVWATITDAGGNTLTAVTTTTVVSPPTASFSWAPTAGGSPLAGHPISFDGSSSTADSADITGWNWDFGDGIAGSGPTATHAYANPGTYSITLTVTDSHGYTASSKQTVTVDAPAPAPAPRRVVRTSSWRNGHRHYLSVAGSGFSPGSVTITISSRGQRYRYRVQIGSGGTFRKVFRYYRALRLVSVS